MSNCSMNCKCITLVDVLPCRCVKQINNVNLTLKDITTSSNCCGNNIKINYQISISYQDNNCLTTSICKDSTLTYLLPNSCCSNCLNPSVKFDCLETEAVTRNNIYIKSNCIISY